MAGCRPIFVGRISPKPPVVVERTNVGGRPSERPYLGVSDSVISMSVHWPGRGPRRMRAAVGANDDLGGVVAGCPAVKWTLARCWARAGRRCGRPRESAGWRSRSRHYGQCHKVSGPRLLRLTGSLPIADYALHGSAAQQALSALISGEPVSRRDEGVTVEDGTHSSFRRR